MAVKWISYFLEILMLYVFYKNQAVSYRTNHTMNWRQPPIEKKIRSGLAIGKMVLAIKNSPSRFEFFYQVSKTTNKVLFSHISPCEKGGRKAREISIRRRNCSQGSCSYFDFPLIITLGILEILRWHLLSLLCTQM